ncbi:MAG: DUF2059 domain-containing protein [Acidobacteriia bacterium]|nr:DUF2059 domain-containing protein [Terriglobia bacterium]
MKIHTPLLFLILATASVFGQQPSAATKTPVPATRADILRLFRAMNTDQQVREVMQQVLAQSRALSREAIKQRHPDVTEAELDRMDKDSEEIARTFPVAELIQDMVPVYQKHLNKADVTTMIAFYSSPTGKKLLREMPAISAEGIQAVYPRLQKSIDETLRRAQEKVEVQNPAAPAPKTPDDKK